MKLFQGFIRLWPYYLVIGPVFRKSLEVGFQKVEQRFDIDFSLCFTGQDHAGLMFSIQLWGLFFEFNITDCRHWNYKEDRWNREGEYDVAPEEESETPK